ncbi:uncharacterized protein [Nothobranchius furzeri]|uniref:uncharacterized protein n=1 Tax=Nothobranchius furzeri TaxID=105023 RepID=UPI003904B650
MVSGPASASVRLPVEAPVEGGRPSPGGWDNQTSSGNRPTAVGLAAERSRLEASGLPHDVVATIQSARAPSTIASYAAKWAAFQNWCAERNVQALSCQLADVLSFLQILMDRGLAFSTVKTYAAAISSCHQGFGDRSVFNHPLTKRFLKGVRRNRPVSRPLFPQWDLTVVLHGLSEAPFEPLDQVSLKFLSLKTALLLALASVNRVSDITALSVAPACLRIREDGGSAVLCPNPAFVPKSINASFKSRSISLAGLFPPPHNSEEEAASHLLCPVRALARYVSRTSGIRRSRNLFVHYRESSLGQVLSAQRLSRWLCDAISLAYTSSGRDPPEALGAHSARGISSSMALLSGVSMEDICQAASWASSCSFTRYYLRDVSSGSITRSVLGPQQAK